MKFFNTLNTLSLVGLNICIFSLGCSTAPSPHQMIDSPLLTAMKPEMEKFLEISKPNRTVGSAGHEAAFQYLKNQFEGIAAKAGGKVIVQEFDPDIEFAIKNYKRDFDTMIKPKYSPSSPEYIKWNRFTMGAIRFVRQFEHTRGKNLILELPGKTNPEEVLYVGAHYDTITHDHTTLQFNTEAPAPGADDNASAVMALLATARELGQRTHDMTVRFVLFDFEEIFFLGSYELAKQMSSMNLKWLRPGERIVGLFNLEMIGWSQADVKTNPVVKVYLQQIQAPGYEAELHLAEAFVAGATQAKAQLKPIVLPNGFDRSDNWSFWQWSFPAVCISEDWEKDFNEKHYHTPGDLPGTLNFPYLKEITLSLIEAVNLASHEVMNPVFHD